LTTVIEFVIILIVPATGLIELAEFCELFSVAGIFCVDFSEFYGKIIFKESPCISPIAFCVVAVVGDSFFHGIDKN
jgi:hypothetical protein